MNSEVCETDREGYNSI